MIHIEKYTDAEVVITPEHDIRDRDLVKKLPGARYDFKTYRWYAPLTWATCITMRGIFKDRLEIGPELLVWAQNYRDRYVDPAMRLRMAWDAPGDADLYPFQRAGVDFLATVERALLCDEMGTGKTPQTIRTLAEITRRGGNPFPAIVVAPNNMAITWKKEFEKWWPGVDVEVIKGAKNERVKIIKRKPHVLIINYEALRMHTRLRAYQGFTIKHCIKCDPTLADIPANQPSRCERCPKELNQWAWKTVIVDEAHRMKNPKAKQTQAIWALRTDETQYVFALTGTIIANTPQDMWPALHLISKDQFPTRGKYLDRYCQGSISDFGTIQIIGLQQGTKDEFFSIIDPMMRRMPKDAVLPHLPKKTYSERYVDMSPKQAKAYKQMEEGLMAIVGDSVMVAYNPLVQMTRLSQFASAYAEIDEQSGEVKMVSPSNKVDALLDLLEDMGEEPLVVFAQSRQLIELAAVALESHGISFGKIVGGQTPDEREYEKTRFQEGRIRVILCTISAGGVGITLTRAGTACFIQRSWSMVDNSQAEDRVHRIGSEIHDKIEIVDIISAGTFEERQRYVLGLKQERLEEVMRDRATVQWILTGNGARPE